MSPQVRLVSVPSIISEAPDLKDCPERFDWFDLSRVKALDSYVPTDSYS